MEIFQKTKHKIIPILSLGFISDIEKRPNTSKLSFSNFVSRFQTSNFRNNKNCLCREQKYFRFVFLHFMSRQVTFTLTRPA